MVALQLKQFIFPELFTAAGLDKLDAQFLATLAQANPELAAQLTNYRANQYQSPLENLVPMVPVENDPFGRFEAPVETHRERDGFQLTDPRMQLREALDEIHYCVYCHKNDGDFCSKGFPVKKNNPELRLCTRQKFIRNTPHYLTLAA